MELQKGFKLGGYEIIEKIGAGGMGIVYKAKQLSLGRLCAIKILPEDMAKDPVYVKKFEREAKNAARISHPNIVQVYDVATEGNIHYIAMEYIEGKTLKDILQEKGKIPWKKTVEILRQSLKALEKAHKEGIIHRDIKPDNIMINKEGEIKVADFGLAKRQNEDLDLTQTGIVVGTPYYMSPEQIEGKPLSGQTDIYSLGITIYQCITGEPPFKGDNPMSTAMMHLKNPLPQIRDKIPDIPEEYERIIRKMCEKDLNKRYKNASEVLKDLQKFRYSKISQTISPQKDFQDSKPDSSFEEVPSSISSSTKNVITLIQKRRKKSHKGLYFILLLFIGIGVFFVYKKEMFYSFIKKIKEKSLSKQEDTTELTQEQKLEILATVEKAKEYEEEGNEEKALELYKKVSSYITSKKIEEKIKILEATVEKKRKTTLFEEEMTNGKVLFKRKKYKEAMQHFKVALSIFPESKEVIEWIEKVKKVLGKCPPGMVKIEDFCIDKYEYPNKRGTIPTSGVSWFEAKRLCEMQGKRLCTEEEWIKACSGKENYIYPYGNQYNPYNCWTERTLNEGPAPSGSMPKCRSSYGVYDMSGNLNEWVDFSNSDTTKILMGGDWLSGEIGSRCRYRYRRLPYYQDRKVGFRCCKDLNN